MFNALKSLILITGLVLGLGTSHISLSKEIQLNKQQCMFFGEILVAIGTDKDNGVPLSDMYLTLEILNLQDEVKSLTQNLVNIIYRDSSKDYQKIAQEFVNFCFKNEGRIPLVEGKML